MTATSAPPGHLHALPLPAGPGRQRARRLAGVLALGAALVVVVLLSLAVGSRPLSLDTVVDVLLRPDGSTAALVVRDLRLPRTLLGVAAGAALGVAGALMQAVTRNPLADPGLLGVNAGAAFAVVVGIAVFQVTAMLGLVWFAFAGAAVSAVAVYALGSLGRGGVTPVRLTLAGAALTALLTALTSAINLLDGATLDRYRFWVVGSLTGRDGAVVLQVLPFIAVGLVLALGVARLLDALALGDDAARALGTRVALTRGLSAVAVTLLCGAATAACGPIIFVGLVIPHVVRLWFGADQRWLLTASALAGPVFLLGGDVAGRVIARPEELQVGIMTAALGGPVFVALVRRARMAQL